MEWNFGSYYSVADIASNGQWNPPYITINLPETGITIRNAYLEFEGLAVSKVNMSNMNIYFNAGTVPGTIVDNITAQYTYRTGESIVVCAKANVTSQITSWTNQNYCSRVIITGPTSNMHSLKLYITY
ncbi:MAG: hypothetical protein COS17_04720, partial [Elusimicrobia bacterium CG02_land_8_20_14_3_00_37_13]